MPEHNSQQLLYAAMNTGQLALAEQQAQAAVEFPKQYGPTTMADGEGKGHNSKGGEGGEGGVECCAVLVCCCRIV